MEHKTHNQGCIDSRKKLDSAIEYAIRTIEETELKLSKLRQPYEEKIIKFKKTRR